MARDFTGKNNPRYAGGDVTLTCQMCNVSFVRNRMKKKAKFCSMGCSIQNLRRPEIIAKRASKMKGRKPNRQYKSGSDSPTWKGGKDRFPDCLECGKKLSLMNASMCISCVRKKLVGVLHPNYKGGKPKCLDCGIIISRSANYCRRHVLAGSRSPKYIKNRENLRRDEKKHLDGRYREWMKAVKNRDGWKCKIANDSCSGRLEAHHILPWKSYPELRYEVNNGISLCCAHHPRARAKEVELAPMFMEIINASNGK